MDANVARRRLEADWERLLQAKDAVEREHLSEETEEESFGELSPIDQHQAAVGSDVFEREKGFSIRDRVDADLQELQDAFRRLELGTYGRCETCGAAIPDARLAAVPATRFCVEHERLWELRSMSTSFPDGPYSDGAPSAERLAEQEAIHHLEFLPDEDQLDEIREFGAEEAALHQTDGQPAAELDPAELEVTESMQWEQEAEERAEADLEERDLRHQAETVAREEAELGG